MIRRGRAEGWLSLPPSALQPWSRLNGASSRGVEVDDIPSRGCGVISAEELPGSEAVRTLMTVPRDLVLSLESVKRYARVDKTLAKILTNLDHFGETTRGAILTFLLCQATLSCLEAAPVAFVRTPFAEYVKFLPLNALPTSWTSIPNLSSLLNGTTLGPALSAKMNSLQREFDQFKHASSQVPWCMSNWWKASGSVTEPQDEEAKMAKLLATLGEERDSNDDLDSEGHEHEIEDGLVTFDDWLQVDNFYRSRALEFPGIGDATVPIIDMANHASGDATSALYECDASGDAVLLLRDGKALRQGDEVTITYGDKKGACEMLFSYGFIEHGMEDAGELFLDLEITNDDPLAKAKMHVNDSAPGFKIYRQNDGGIGWEGDFIWLIVVNEEDGLDFRILQGNDGTTELKAFWKDQVLTANDGELQRQLENDSNMWDVFQLRAIATLQARVQGQIEALAESAEALQSPEAMEGYSHEITLISRLRDLERKLLESADNTLESQKVLLLDSHSVTRYLRGDVQIGTEEDDDFT